MEAAASHPDYPMWSALLRWSLSQGGDGTSSPRGAMSAEDRAFLEKVMKEYTVDVAKAVSEHLSVVSRFAGGEGEAEACEAALDAIEELTIDLDMARDLCKLGGVREVLRAARFEGATSGVRRAAAGVIAAVAQNDEACQNAVAAEGGVATLEDVVERASESDERRVAFGALSATIRGHPSLEEAFIRGRGPHILSLALGADARTASKAAFLLYAITYERTDDAALDALAPAFRAAVDATAYDPSPETYQRRESAINALVRAAQASTAFAQSYRESLDAAADDAQRALSDHPDDTGLKDHLALWSQLPWRRG